MRHQWLEALEMDADMNPCLYEVMQKQERVKI